MGPVVTVSLQVQLEDNIINKCTTKVGTLGKPSNALSGHHPVNSPEPDSISIGHIGIMVFLWGNGKKCDYNHPTTMCLF